MNTRMFAMGPILCLAACGGSGQPPVPDNAGTVIPGPAVPKVVTYLTGANNCLTSHNADEEVRYALGDKPAEYLTWHCADHDVHQRRQVRVSLLYDYDNQCYVPKSEHVDFAHCSVAAPPTPSSPTVAVRILALDLMPGRNMQSLPGFSYAVTLENAGNIPVFDVALDISITGSDGSVGKSSAAIHVIEPQQTAATHQFDNYGASYAGKAYTVTVMALDAYGQPLAARPVVGQVTVPP